MLASTNNMLLYGPATSLTGNVDFAAGGYMTLDGNVKAINGTIDLTSDDFLWMDTNGLLFAEGDIIVWCADGMTLRSATSSTGNIDAINGQGGLFVNSNVTAHAGSITLTSDSNLVMIPDSSISASGTIDLTAGDNLTMWENAGVSADGAVTLKSTNNMILQAVASSTGNVTATSGGDIWVTNGAAVSAGGDLVMESSNLSVGVGSALSAGSNATLAVTNELQMQNNSSLSAEGDVRTSSGGDSTLYSAVTSTNGTIWMDAGDSLMLNVGNTLTADGDITMLATNLVNISVVSSATGNVVGVSDQWLEVEGSVTASNGTIRLKSIGGMDMWQDSFLLAGGNVTLDSEDYMTLQLVSSLTGNVAATSNGKLQLYTNATAGGSMDLTSGADLYLWDESTLLAGDDITLKSVGDMTLHDIISTNGNAKARAGGGIWADGSISAGQAVVLHSTGGDVNVSGSNETLSGEHVTLWADSGSINNQSAVDAGKVFAAQAALDITLAGTISAGGVGLRSTGGTISAPGSISASGTVGAGMDALAGNLEVDRVDAVQVFQDAGGDLSASSGNPAAVDSSSYYAHAGGTEKLNATGTRTNNMHLEFQHATFEDFDTMVFHVEGGGTTPPPTEPEGPEEPSVPPPTTGGPEIIPPTPIGPALPSIENGHIQQALSFTKELPEWRMPELTHDNLFFLYAAVPYPGIEDGMHFIQYIAYRLGHVEALGASLPPNKTP